MRSNKLRKDIKLKRNLKIVIALSVIGILLSLYLLFQHYSKVKDPFCDALGGGCEIVNRGSFSEVDGIFIEFFGIYINFPFPVSLIGTFGFFIGIILACLILEDNTFKFVRFRIDKNLMIKLMFGLNVIGFIIAIFLTYIEFIVLGTFCPYCDATKIIFTVVSIITALNIKYLK